MVELDPFVCHLQIGRRISDARKRAGLSQDELAERLRMPVLQIAALEAGREAASPRHLCAFAAALETTVGYFFHSFDEDAEPDYAISELREELTADFAGVVDAEMRRQLLHLMRELAADCRRH